MNCCEQYERDQNYQKILDMHDEIERLRARVEVLERVREAALPHLFEPSMASGTVLLKALQDAKP